MTHPGALLSAFLDGETTEDESADVSRHVETCGQCRVEIDELAAARAAVRGLPLLELPDDVEPRGGTVVSMRRRRLVASAAVAAAAVATVVVGFGSAMVETVSIDPGQVSSILAASSSLPLDAPAGSEIGGYVTEAASARFTARQTTSCRTPEGVVDSTVDLTQAGGFTLVSDPLGDPTVLVPGSVSTGPVAGPIRTTTVLGDGPRLDAAYSVSSVVPGELRDRPVDVVTVRRDGIDRMVWTVDSATGAILHREIMSADGSVVCRSELVEFHPIPSGITASIPFPIDAEVVRNVFDAGVADVPPAVGGLTLTSAYDIERGSVAVYSDGLLTAAVVIVDGPPDEASIDRNVAGRSVTIWEADGRGYAVFGALPADVLDAVLDDLPEPSGGNPVARFLGRLSD